MKHPLPIHTQPWTALRTLMMGVLVAVLLAGCASGPNPPQEEPTAAANPAAALPDPLAAGWEGQSVCEVLEDNAHHRILKCSFPPGVGHEQHYHAPHTGYTLAGATFRITDSTGTRTVDVPTGYVFGKDEVSVHAVLNVGETTGEFLIIEPKR